MEPPDEPQAQNQYLRFNGAGVLVSFPLAAGMYAYHSLINKFIDSSGVCAIVRTREIMNKIFAEDITCWSLREDNSRRTVY